MAASINTKLDGNTPRVFIAADEVFSVLKDIFMSCGCSENTSRLVAEHLVDASLCGVESHGVMRVLQYVEQFQNGYMNPQGEPSVFKNASGAIEISGQNGIGIPAMHLAYAQGMEQAQKAGISALAIRNVGHTGRHGAFADHAAECGFLTMCLGGGNRRIWRQVAPHGGAKAMLPTNPWCVGIPGGERGAVVMDFATSKIAGGWIYAAKSAGALLPDGCVIDSNGMPTRSPDDYFAGGAILPSGGHKGYALALVGELIGEAMLGPATTECNWLLITMKGDHFRQRGDIKSVAEEILNELRVCPPAPGFERVEIPGEREREQRQRSEGVVPVPEATWQQILAIH
jgi:LDH2 family malate/lactate/ureidoglycolate dehydrogenase